MTKKPTVVQVALERLIASERAQWDRSDSPAESRVAERLGASRMSVHTWRKTVRPHRLFEDKIVSLAAQLPTEKP